ncbi:hypothetical protein [Methylobacter sp. S3L5C]|uniref:hypothetical protein n=1 Tax=Methylobacter sp. S3L5C TaxID=2839024 RepID=UPI001FAE5043|nr:hypothetical protein [Methylobacter sp. S3L5C]UOA07147.1 hypothetical protein KKZ03_12615 [Methylobacter sp. S3L5C]
MKKSDSDFLSNNLSIDIDWLVQELNSPKIIQFKQILGLFISSAIDLLGKNNSEKEILELFKLSIASNNNEKLYEIIDSLRQAFTSYASGGLFDLYIYQSNESWYPKIVLKSVLKPNDISVLSSSIDVYRGCDISEFNSKRYGQSWSTSIEVAKKFAYQHYNSQPWYKKEKRCVLKATIKKESVFFSRQNHYEKEIAVNIEKLSNVQKT